MSKEIISIPTTDIKGKQYTEVKDRVMFFRTDKQFQGWRLITEPTQLDEKVAIFKAYVHDNNNNLVSTGYAMEKAGNGFINKDSHVENAETSAVGRALGFLGIGIVGGIASVDEIKEVPKLTQDQLNDIEDLIKKKGADRASLFGYFKISSYDEMTPEIYANALAMLSKKKNARVAA